MLSKFYKIKPETFFIFIAVFFEILFNIVTPPLQAPDELNHFYRAYQIADGNFLPERTKDRLGGQIPICFNEFLLPYNFAATNLKYTFDKKDILNSFKVKFDGNKKEFRDFPSTTTYSPISYFPQVLAVFIIKQFDCSVATLYYGGRLFSFIFWLLIMYTVIKMVPIYKWLFTTIILLPMNLYVANAFSADGVNNCLTFLFIALVLKHIFSDGLLTKKDMFLILMVLVLLALAKFVYISFIVLLFLIPANKFKSRTQRFGGIATILILALIVVSLWSKIYVKNYIMFSEYDSEHRYGVGLSPCADYKAQKEYILEHGFYFFKVIYHSIVDHPQTFLKGYIGAFGQADIALPNWIYVFSYLILLFIAISESNKIALKIPQKAVFLLAAFSAFVLILLSIHLMWDCVGEGVVDLIQGRYLIPIFPLLFILFSNKKFNVNLTPIIYILPFLIFIYLFSSSIIFTRYFKESFSKKIEFYCDGENNDGNGFFSTNNSNIKLEGIAAQTKDEHRSGNYSALVTQDYPYCFSYKFKNLNRGDLIEMEAWKKGNGGALVLSGKGSNCEDFFMSKNETVLTDKNGWSKIHFVLTMTQKCDDSEAVFFAWNPNNTKVYFDDIKFCIKKYKSDYLIGE